MSDLKYPDHEHPHGVENKQENPFRIWLCEECPQFFPDEEIRRDIATGKWGHICKAKKFRNEARCESHLEPYMPDMPDVKP